MLVNSNDDIKTIVAFSSGVISSILYHVSIYTLFVKTAQGRRWHSLRSGVLHIALNTPRWQLLQPKAWGKQGMEPNLMCRHSINPIPFSPIYLLFLCLLICYSITERQSFICRDHHGSGMDLSKHYRVKHDIFSVCIGEHNSYTHLDSVIQHIWSFKDSQYNQMVSF